MPAPDSSRQPFNAVITCPHCGGSSAHPFAAGGVCLRCAGERVLALDISADSASPASSSSDLGALRRSGTDGLPVTVGPYEIIEELGRGGMARVFAARQTALGRIVALKVLPEGRGGVAGLELRFLREAQTAARLRHAHIVSVHDSGRADGFVYFSMDYIDGGDLAHRLRERPCSPWEAAAIAHKIAGALAYTHAEGVLHRDVKPSNILLDGEEPRLADFGLAAQLEPGGDLTAVTSIVGTAHYLAPEALRDGTVALSVASDIYALGVVLFEMLTGRPPFAGAAPAELVRLVETAEPPSPRLLAPVVPRDLETICLKCLAHDPARRYASAVALAEDLRRFLADEPILARPVSVPGRFLQWCRRRPALAAVWLLVCALAAGSTLAAVWIDRAEESTEQALALARQSAAEARVHLREAKVGEARAVRRTTIPGRRAQALAAIAAAASIRPGADLRDEAAAALMLPDISPGVKWDPAPGTPGELTFAPGGEVVALEMLNATGAERSPATLWRWGARQPFATLEPPPAAIVGPLRFSADSKLVMARYADETLRVWRTGEPKPFLTLEHRPLPGGAVHTEPFNSDYDFSPDGALLALGLAGGGVALHRVSDGGETARWVGGGDFSLLRFSPDGRHLAAVRISSYEERHFFVLKTPECTLEHTFALDASPNLLNWSDDSRVVAVAQVDNTIVAFDLRDGRELQKLPTAARDLWCLAFVADDRFILERGSSTTIYLSSFAIGQEEIALPGIGAGMFFTARGDEDFYTASIEGVATRWHVEPPLAFRVVPTPRVDGYAYGAGGGAFDFSPDGRWVASAHARYTPVRDVAVGRLVDEYDAGVTPADDFCGVSFAADGASLIRVSPYAGLQRFTLRPGAGGRLLGAPEVLDAEREFTLAAHSEDRRRLLLIDMNGGRVKVVELGASGARRLSGWTAPGVYSGSFSPDGERVLLNFAGVGPGAEQQRLRIYRAHDGTVLHELSAPVSCDVSWSADGRTVMTSNGVARSILWDATKWRPIADLHGDLAGNPTTFTLSPDSKYAAIARDDGIMLVSARDGRRLVGWKSPGASGPAVAIRFLPDGHRFGVLWRDGRIDIIDPVALRAALVPLGLAW